MSCHKCGTPAPDDAEFCFRCGTKLVNPSGLSPAGTVRPPIAVADRAGYEFGEDSARSAMAATGPYASLAGFAGWVVALLVGGAVVRGGQVIFDIASIATLAQMLDGLSISSEEVRTFDALYLVLSLAGLAALVATAVVFLVWNYRAYRNLAAFGASELTTSPG
jgi:Domain of unknown function (DUF4328)/zinc-ribbon domain